MPKSQRSDLSPADEAILGPLIDLALKLRHGLKYPYLPSIILPHGMYDDWNSVSGFGILHADLLKPTIGVRP